MSGASDSEGALFDPGLQPERTLLAWRRTCLAFAVASLIATRFTLPSFGLLAVLLGTLGAGLAGFAYALASAGYRAAHRSLRDRGNLGRSGLPMLATTGSVLFIGTMCGFYIGSGVVKG